MTEEAFAKIKSDVEYCGEIGFEAELLAHIQQQDERISGYLTDIAILKQSNVGLMREKTKYQSRITQLEAENGELRKTGLYIVDKVTKLTAENKRLTAHINDALEQYDNREFPADDIRTMGSILRQALQEQSDEA